MTYPWILGVDPGGKNTGMCLLDRSGAPVWWSLVTRENDFDAYLLEVLQSLDRAISHATGSPIPPPRFVVAVEDLNPPSPHMGFTSVQGLIDTAQVLGAVRAQVAVNLVPPGGHGSKPLMAYPSTLHGKGEKKGTGKMRHVRSAFDVAKYHRARIRLTRSDASDRV